MKNTVKNLNVTNHLKNKQLKLLKEMMKDDEGLDLYNYSDLDRLYDWLREDKREPANTKFGRGKLRNVAREIEFLIRNGKNK
jgi:hypothetical protein